MNYRRELQQSSNLRGRQRRGSTQGGPCQKDLREVALSWASREEGTKKERVVNKSNKCTEGPVRGQILSMSVEPNSKDFLDSFCQATVNAGVNYEQENK